MKLFAQPIQVSGSSNGPSGFCWRGRAYRVVEQLDHWRIRTRWWAQEEERDYFQVLAHCLDGDAARDSAAVDTRLRDADTPPREQGVYELYRRGDQWFMGRVVD